MVFQCILSCARDHPTRLSSHLLAASGPNIYTMSWDFEEVISVWPEQPPSDKEDVKGKDAVAPPTKKRKIANEQKRPNVIKLLCTRDEKNIVAVTAEDKCIRVFNLKENGKLEQLSERCMPKRPNAVAISPDETTLLVGDKFGDVYALPLLESAEEEEPTTQPTITAMSDVRAKPFKPTANPLTVHSGSNRKALASQLQVKEHVKTKEPLKFRHELLLGHVSMLTDLAVMLVDDDDGNIREYIITADRDEHIRISRGRPQAHIIEGYCLGHKQFISKLRLPAPNLLVSAGGENEIYVWDWLAGRLLRKIDIGPALRDFRASWKASPGIREGDRNEDDQCEDQQTAISGLWIGLPGSSQEKLIVTCEGVPALIYIQVSSLTDYDTPRVHTVPLLGNVLDVTVMSDLVVAAIDNIHQPWSTSALHSPDEQPPLLQLLKFEQFLYESVTEVDTGAFRLSDQVSSKPSAPPDNEAEQDVHVDRDFWELVYHVEKLRKRGGMGDEG
ncbi:hypothetical protein EV356DRAFT_508232 [Viridothelium virens]|uniref:Uncharacterized protein n=1 Tax=Viridothelium virens TaxID=1048519 RepID=A0A6A6GY81_VIRVR|nr:hypothetical protein EV356DRAFT_508232 [Viridothelium virens]